MSYTLEQAVELGTLTTLIGREARNQPYEAMLGVAWSVRNRVQAPRYWGTSWLSVMAFKYAYSSLTALGDPNLIVWPDLSAKVWEMAAACAETAYLGSGEDPVSGATHYVSEMAEYPAWVNAPDTQFVIQLAAFRFYKAY